VGDREETPLIAMISGAAVVLPIGGVRMQLAFGAAWLFG